MRPSQILLAILPVLIASSCNLINPPEDIPAYIRVEGFELNTEISEGSSSHKITELWLYSGGKLVGIYDVPFEVPVLQTGEQDFQIFAGIKNNGISLTRIVYPFYTDYTGTVSLEPGITDTIYPEFGYIENIDFWMENFEDPGIKFNKALLSDTTLDLTQVPSEVLEGTGSGIVHLTEERNYFYALTEETLDLPAGGQIFLEMDYRCNNTFAVGLLAYSGLTVDKAAAMILNPTGSGADAEWNKIYIELSYVAGQFLSADHFELYLESSLDNGNDDAFVQFDNIKIIHR
jgi:hypothetical protein